LRKIVLTANVYAKLEEKAQAKGLTPDELASQIVLKKIREVKT